MQQVQGCLGPFLKDLGISSLLVGAPKYLLYCLQSVLNAAARLLCNRRKYDHVTRSSVMLYAGSQFPFDLFSRSACWSTSRSMGQRLGICATIVRRRIRPLRGYDFDYSMITITITGLELPTDYTWTIL